MGVVAISILVILVSFTLTKLPRNLLPIIDVFLLLFSEVAFTLGEVVVSWG